MSEVLKLIEQEQMRTDLPKLEVGDHVKVHVKIKEGNKERIQIFEGIVIRLKGDSIRQSFTVRKVSYGVGVERIFPYHSPIISTIEVVRQSKVARAKLYYMRERKGKAIRLKPRKDHSSNN